MPGSQIRSNSVSKFSNSGAVLSPSTGYTGGGLSQPRSIAIDGSENVWTANTVGNNVSEFSHSGAAVSPSTGYTGGGLDNPVSIAMDNSGNAWIADSANSVSKFSRTGTALSPSTGYTGGGLNDPPNSPLTETATSGLQTATTMMCPSCPARAQFSLPRSDTPRRWPVPMV